MSYAPASIMNVRHLIQKYIPLKAVELGIVGDDSHANSGSSYHLGKDVLKASSYSVVESVRDRNGLSNAVSALDIGWFNITTPKGKKNLRDLSKWLVAQCKVGTDDTDDIREIIYSADGVDVLRWDRLKKRTTGDNSHLNHTHVSWFRDSETNDKTALFERWFIEIGLMEDPTVLNASDKEWIKDLIEANNVKQARANWDHRLVRPDKTDETVSAGDIQRWSDIVHTNTRDIVIAAVEKGIASILAILNKG